MLAHGCQVVGEYLDEQDWPVTTYCLEEPAHHAITCLGDISMIIIRAFLL